MRIIFFGTGKFALPTVKSLIDSEHEVAAVVTQPDSKKGRGWNVLPTPVKAFVEKAAPGLEVLQPEDASEEGFIRYLNAAGADVFVVVDYGKILPPEVLDVPEKGCLNLHPSLLPKYRGAAPLNWVIVNGEEETGNTVIMMNERMDAGSVIAQETTPIGEEDAAQLGERLSRAGAELMMKSLGAIVDGSAESREQDEAEASYAPKLTKNDGEVDWTQPAVNICARIRGLQPWPGAFTRFNGRTLKIIKAAVDDTGTEKAPAGAVIGEKDLIVAAGEGAVRIITLQMEGKKAMSADGFLRGHSVKKGTILG